jgi:hypothetical protein
VKKLILLASLSAFAFTTFAQDSTDRKRSTKDEKKEEKRQRINAMIKQQEEGVLVFRKQSVFGIELRSTGYGAFYELGRMKSVRRAMIYKIEITEIKHPKEDKLPNGGFVFGNPYVYGKLNNFYQVKLGLGQQIMLGQKGNKNGVAVLGIIDGGLSLGLLRPYYLEIVDSTNNARVIKYEDDTTAFVNNPIIGGTGISKGWNEIKMKPGAYIRTAVRFDFGRFNESVQALEAGIILEGYASKIPIMLFQKEKQLFFQVYIAMAFGGRK